MPVAPQPDAAGVSPAATPALLNAILESSALPIVALDRAGRVVVWNPAAETVFGWRAAEVVGKPAPHVAASARAEFEARLGDVLAGRRQIGERVSRRRRDGSAVELVVSSAPMVDIDGKTVGIVAVMRDISEEVALEHSRAEADRLFRSAFENAPNGITIVDAEGGYVDVNPAACAIFGRDRETLLATGFAELTHPDDLAANRKALARVFAGEIDTFQLDKRFLAPDGSVIWADLRTSVIRDDQGRPQFFVSQIVDVGARKEAERALAESVKQIEAVSRVAQRLLTEEDARPVVCQAVAEIAGADLVMLSERQADGALEITAATTQTLVGVTFAADDPPQTARLLVGGASVFVPDVSESELVPAELVKLTGASSVLFEPVAGEHGVEGGLTAVWRRPVPEVAARVLETIRLLATEASIGLERTALMQRLEEQALTDPLTGLPNRRAFEREIDRELARARRGGRLTVGILDLDYFKRFNDTHGHAEGDRLLREVAAAWRGQLRGGDTLARIGGEEFVAILPDCAESTAKRILDRLRHAVPDEQTCSIGFAGWDGRESVERLLERADEALYAAKSAGRNRTMRSG